MKKQILDTFSEHGILLQPDVIEYIMAKNDAVSYVSSILQKGREYPLFVTVDYLKELEKELIGKKTTLDIEKNEVKAAIETVVEKPATQIKIHGGFGTFKPLAKEHADEVKIVKDVTNISTSEGELKDFVHCFSSRFTTIKKMLRHRVELSGSVSISDVKNSKGAGEIKTICMVVDVKKTKNGHKIVVLEDETGMLKILIPKKSPLVADCVLKDEVVGVIGRMDRNYTEDSLIIGTDIVRPDIPVTKENNNLADVEISAAFISDIHVGSNTFLTKSWSQFLKWINGYVTSDKEKEFVGRIKYIVIPGDVVDGIGVYPNQEEELKIKDIYAQYEELARYLEEIPDYIKMIMLPGNHDAVRLAEPQPAFPSEITKLFDSNISFVGNPSYFTLHNVEVLAYHGRSMDDFITTMSPRLTYSKPIDSMKEMLKRRHLAPIYGERTSIAPEHVDHLVIERVPDIFVTGHVHATGVDVYRGVTLINASAWQSQTAYQKTLGFNPDPAKVPIINLHTMSRSVANFNNGR